MSHRQGVLRGIIQQLMNDIGYILYVLPLLLLSTFSHSLNNMGYDIQSMELGATYWISQ